MVHRANRPHIMLTMLQCNVGQTNSSTVKMRRSIMQWRLGRRRNALENSILSALANKSRTAAHDDENDLHNTGAVTGRSNDNDYYVRRATAYSQNDDCFWKFEGISIRKAGNQSKLLTANSDGRNNIWEDANLVNFFSNSANNILSQFSSYLNLR